MIRELGYLCHLDGSCDPCHSYVVDYLRSPLVFVYDFRLPVDAVKCCECHAAMHPDCGGAFFLRGVKDGVRLSGVVQELRGAGRDVTVHRMGNVW